MQAEAAREKAVEALREADRAECLAWSLRMEGFGGRAQPSPTIAQCLNGGLGWLEVPSLRYTGQPAGCDPTAQGHAAVEAGGIVRVPVMQDAALQAASLHGQAYRVREITPSPWHHPENEDGH